MSQFATQQLDAIHSMLAAGHRNLRVERHSLVLWGVSCSGLILLSTHILTAEQFPDLKQRAFAWLALLATTLAGVSLLDWQLTRRVKQARDEAWSFLHRQVLKVWWLLMTVGVLMTFATFFYGGGYMIYSAWLVLVGLGLYVHGLFSEELLEWSGALIIAVGIGSLTFRLDIVASRHVAASTMGLGLPVLALMLDRGKSRAVWMRLGQSLGWLLLVLSPPLLAKKLETTIAPPNAPLVSIEEFRRHPSARQIVLLPAGSPIPVKIEVSGNIFRPNQAAVLPLELNAPLEILMDGGQPTGDWRFPGENWVQARGVGWVSIPWLKTELTPETGPQIRGALIVETRPQPAR